MADFGATELDAFRAETRTWLEANYPSSLNEPMGEDDAPWGGRTASYSNPDVKLWLDRMGAKGWTAPTWPKQYGGGGLTKEQAKVLEQELRRIKARPALMSFGIWMLGPVLLEYASEEQKQRFLPPIVRGEIRWCQGYSEPGSGSDLASLQTRCEDKGDHYLINGQKVWTSYADHADWIFCLVRTDTTKKHEGISFILFDMTSPGVEPRPIKLISGSSPFCETFFTDVKVPKDQLVGKLNGGWDIAKRLLQYERQNISASGFGGTGGGFDLIDVAKEHVGVDDDGRLLDGDLRSRIAAHKMDAAAFMLTVRRAEMEAKANAGPSAATSIIKYAAAKMNQERTELMMEALGLQGLGWEGPGFSGDELGAPRAMLRAKANSIEGGTSEINLNVVAKRVLGLLDHQ
ncbi:alkylation response protein AidB-like acyl-CoA dehydrogenase [Caulobacter ginsengisoli]|uniref:Alkylation response protein AidB-like acyl-CoA dehydrogenase n=1 Tax=Caulobacter ginsengisoli TaxID=400775 RepID=A0ABU0IXZ8_9CAUL|nr:acyl-CoA dehydrogenase family protein [Caulobacter ginsengisoli]MDQ0465929.1 alkylation response protein AidB-like acyl-CoA dehydrogenase [Caulobacter ginsengisoli]